jgi:hypothetical protein
MEEISKNFEFLKNNCQKVHNILIENKNQNNKYFEIIKEKEIEMEKINKKKMFIEEFLKNNQLTGKIYYNN